MAYPEKGAKYAGQDRATSLCRASGGAADDEPLHVRLAKGLNTASRIMGTPYNPGAVGVQRDADMSEAERVVDSVPRTYDVPMPRRDPRK